MIFIFLFLILIIGVIGITCFVLWIIMLIDCINRQFDKKFKWLLILNLVPFGFIFYYFMVRRKNVTSKKPGKLKQMESLAMISFVVGLISYMMFIYFGMIFGALAIILGIIAKRKIIKNRNLNGLELAKSGIVFGVIGTVLQILIFTLYFTLIGYLIYIDVNNPADESPSFIEENMYLGTYFLQ